MMYLHLLAINKERDKDNEASQMHATSASQRIEALVVRSKQTKNFKHGCISPFLYYVLVHAQAWACQGPVQ